MPNAASKQVHAPSMSDAAVQAKTGKPWTEWFDLLDRGPGLSASHRDRVAFLSEHHELGPWWGQMVAVNYEQARGLRQKHQKTAGYEISRSKTIAAPASELFRSFSDARRRRRWLADPDITIRTSTPHKSIRATWTDGASSIEAAFYPKGESRCQIVVQHSKLPDAVSAERMKVYWSEQLERLCELFNKETRTP